MQRAYPYRYGAMLSKHEDVADRLDRYLRNRPHIKGLDREMLEEIATDIRRVIANENAQMRTGLHRAVRGVASDARGICPQI